MHKINLIGPRRWAKLSTLSTRAQNYLGRRGFNSSGSLLDAYLLGNLPPSIGRKTLSEIHRWLEAVNSCELPWIVPLKTKKQASKMAIHNAMKLLEGEGYRVEKIQGLKGSTEC